MNKNTFNPVRFIHYLRKDWTENRGQFFYDFIIPYGILTLLFIWIDFTKTRLHHPLRHPDAAVHLD